jgi:hypothetical protein
MERMPLRNGSELSASGNISFNVSERRQHDTRSRGSEPMSREQIKRELLAVYVHGEQGIKSPIGEVADRILALSQPQAASSTQAVLPPRKAQRIGSRKDEPEAYGYVSGWNDCLEACKRLASSTTPDRAASSTQAGDWREPYRRLCDLGQDVHQVAPAIGDEIVEQLRLLRIALASSTTPGSTGAVQWAAMGWPNKPFTVRDEPGEHDPCWLIFPSGEMLALNHHAANGVDQARAQFIADACNAVLFGHRPSDDELWDQTLRDRDRYHEVADDLANGIAQHLGRDIGEHSSMNDPWQNALDAIEEAALAQPAQQGERGLPVDEELPGMWERADLIGGATDSGRVGDE